MYSGVFKKESIKLIFYIIFIYFIFLEVNVFATDIYLYIDPVTGGKIFSNIPLNSAYKLYLRVPIKYANIGEIFTTSINLKKYDPIFEEVAKNYNLDPALLKAIAKVESNFNPFAISPKGAIGIMQLLPSTAELVGVKNPFDPIENIHGGARYLKLLLDEFKDLEKSLAAYNAGPGVVKTYKGIPPFKETQNYVKSVLYYYRLFKH